MRRQDIQVGDERVYGGGPVSGGWFTVMCKVRVIRHGKSRVQIQHLEGLTPGKQVWVSHRHLSPEIAVPSACGNSDR